MKKYVNSTNHKHRYTKNKHLKRKNKHIYTHTAVQRLSTIFLKNLARMY